MKEHRHIGDDGSPVSVEAANLQSTSTSDRRGRRPGGMSSARVGVDKVQEVGVPEVYQQPTFRPPCLQTI